MQKLFILVALAFLPFCSIWGDDGRMLDRLDSVLAVRKQVAQIKEQRISLLKDYLSKVDNVQDAMKFNEELFNEYKVYQFDSAMIYIDKTVEYARGLKDSIAVNRLLVKKASLLCLGGLYGEAFNVMKQTSPIGSRDNIFHYYFTYFIFYNYLTEYYNDAHFSPAYKQKACRYLSLANQYLDRDMIGYHYYKAEYLSYVLKDNKAARQHYFQTLNDSHAARRFQAMAAFAIACQYRNSGNNDLYTHYLIKSAILDVQGNIKENMALQELAFLLMRKSKENIVRADNYIRISLDDAQFYNSRLRVIEISRKLPLIVESYEAYMKTANGNLKIATGIGFILSLFCILFLVYIFKQNKQLSLHKAKLSGINEQLTRMNKRLETLNRALFNTNQLRESLVKIYIDLCAKYINRLNKYKVMVNRKIRAHQAEDLLNSISSTKLSNEEAETFTKHFDAAFLELYPTFLEEFNSLLTEPFKQLHNRKMLPEQRVYALIRLGVTESSVIAAVLFYSPQTVYNYRSLVKSRAKIKENFDEQVQQLCTITNVQTSV